MLETPKTLLFLVFIQSQQTFKRTFFTIGVYKLLCFLAIGEVLKKDVTLGNVDMGVNAKIPKCAVCPKRLIFEVNG